MYRCNECSQHSEQLIMYYGSTSHTKTETIFSWNTGTRFYFTNTKLQNGTPSQGTEIDHTELHDESL